MQKAFQFFNLQPWQNAKKKIIGKYHMPNYQNEEEKGTTSVQPSFMSSYFHRASNPQ
jgi:hypothetical protein